MCLRQALSLFHPSADPITQIYRQGVDRTGHESQIMPRGMQLVDQRNHDAKGGLVQIKIVTQIAQQLNPGDVDASIDNAIVVALRPDQIDLDEPDKPVSGQPGYGGYHLVLGK